MEIIHKRNTHIAAEERKNNLFHKHLELLAVLNLSQCKLKKKTLVFYLAR